MTKAQKLEIIGSVFKGRDIDGDFGWMIKQPEYNDAFFIFNDNLSQFVIHINDPDDPAGCVSGGGNAIIRPYQCLTPPRAGGIPTGPNFNKLDESTRNLINKAVDRIEHIVLKNNFTRIIYSSDGKGSLGTGIFKVADDVKMYIVNRIQQIGHL